MNIVPADRYSFAELAELFTRGYEGYSIPVHIDEASMKYIVDAWSIDLSRSRVAEDAGICNLGVRGDLGWIGGLGVVPEQRRHGIGRALMESVLDNAPSTVDLEVIEGNDGAKRLYDDLGFKVTRLLEVWSLPEQPEIEARLVDPSPLGQRDLPWQRADEALPADYDRWEVDGGAMLLKGGNVLQLQAADIDAATALLSRGKALSYVNVPEGDVASAALAALGGTMSLRQFEMRLVR
ncbi:MAG TPA: GNAT family N-acetyltransferase [Gaiellaceae bacterium]|jgi:GNAT superfamily N-acetyltransferase